MTSIRMRLAGLAAGLALLAGCDPMTDVVRGTATVQNGETIKTCFDTALTPETPGYFDVSALPDLTKASFEGLGIPMDEWRESDRTGIGVSFGDTTSYESKQFNSNPMRDCWVHGDPRDSGLRRYSLRLIQGASQSHIKDNQALYTIFFDGQTAIYIEGRDRAT